MSNVTISDVAQHAGVGIGTVSRVLNNRPSVREQTRQKVLASVKALNYTPSQSARRLVLGKSLTIAVVTPFLTSPAFVERLRGIEHTLRQSEYDLVLHIVESESRRDACFEQLSTQNRVDGIIIISLSPNDNHVHRFQASDIPTVLLDAHHEQLNRIIIDDVEGGYKAVQHLTRLGHQRIGYVSDPMEHPLNFVSNLHRYQGYRNALAEADIPFNPTYHRTTQPDWLGAYTSSWMAAYEHSKVLLSSPNRPTAIFAASDTQASGVLRAANELDIAVPEQLSVVGYDDHELAEYWHLTTIRQPLHAMGVEAVNLVLDEINAKQAGDGDSCAVSPDDSRPKCIQMPIELIVRGTTGPVPCDS
ncbi:MAG: LacI family DNA-binding transcriptional regulator [Chloroflexota bacterium]